MSQATRDSILAAGNLETSLRRRRLGIFLIALTDRAKIFAYALLYRSRSKTRETLNEIPTRMQT